MPDELKNPLSSLPSDSKLVFQGKLFATYQWQQEMFDGTYKTFEKVSRPGCANVIITTSDKKIIIAKEEQPGRGAFYGSVGGRIDSGESPEQAAHRELLEESGFETADLKLWFGIQLLEKVDFPSYTFIAKNCKKIEKPELESGERIDLQTLTFDEFIETTKSPIWRDVEIAIQIYRMQRNKTWKEDLQKIFFE